MSWHYAGPDTGHVCRAYCEEYCGLGKEGGQRCDAEVAGKPQDCYLKRRPAAVPTNAAVWNVFRLTDNRWERNDYTGDRVSYILEAGVSLLVHMCHRDGPVLQDDVEKLRLIESEYLLLRMEDREKQAERAEFKKQAIAGVPE